MARELPTAEALRQFYVPRGRDEEEGQQLNLVGEMLRRQVVEHPDTPYVMLEFHLLPHVVHQLQEKGYRLRPLGNTVEHPCWLVMWMDGGLF